MKWITRNCFLFIHWHQRAFFYFIRSNRPERIHVASTIVDGKFMFDLFRQFSLDDILRAQLFSLAFCEFRLIFAVHVILSGSFTGRQIDIFAIGLFDSDFTTKSRIIGFVPPIETIVRVATDWIEEIKAKQINARFFYCIYFEKWMDYSSAFCTFAAADFFVVQTFLFVEMTDCIFERKILNVWGALNWKHANAPCQ